MRLEDHLPQGVTVDGRFYKMDFDFRNVLRMIDILDRDDLIPEARAYNALHCLCRRPRNTDKVLNAVKQLLFKPQGKGGKGGSGQKATDFVQDAELIRAAFMQTYGINLWREKLHWFEFTELLHGIPEGTRYSETVGIRLREMPEPTKWNRKEREWLMKAKASVAIHMSEKERESRYNRDVQNIFHALLPLAEKEVKPPCQTDGSSLK